MKIKRSLKSKHIYSRSNIVVEIFAEFTYKIVLFSDTSITIRTLETIAECACRMINLLSISIKINTFEVFAVFAYKMTLFFDNMQDSESCKTKNLESAYDFDISSLQNSHLISCNCDESKALLLRYFDNLRYLFDESHCFTHTTWSVWFNIRCQDCYVYENRCCRERQLVMKESYWRKEVRKWSSNETLESKELDSIDMT